MKRTIFFHACVCLTLSAAALVRAHEAQPKPPPQQTAARQAGPTEPLALDHGGKIVTVYDGFAHETVVALKAMSVTCGGARGTQGVVKGVCVNLAASLHCPGKQVDYVRSARLRLVFETKNWDSRHAPDERELSVVADGETMRLGRLELVKQNVGEGWFDERSREVLEVVVPYETFRKIARAVAVEMSVGKTAFALRDKNVAALRDMNNRVNLTRR
jgi:hypothetical protein